VDIEANVSENIFIDEPTRLMAQPPFEQLPAHHFKAILADPPWRFKTYDRQEYVLKGRTSNLKGAGSHHYHTMEIEAIKTLPVAELAADDCALFLWITWPNLIDAFDVMFAWGFFYKTCAFCWTKADAGQIEMFRDDFDDQMGLGYWTRANSEVCLLGTKGNPQRLSKGVRQAIIEPRREHSRKPDIVRERIERLVAGPFLELFSRSERHGWRCWGNEIGKFK